MKPCEINRRTVLAALAAGSLPVSGQTKPVFSLPKLDYPYDALEPYIDARTMEIHHSRHHQAYVNNLNQAVASHPKLASMTVEELLTNLDALPAPVRTAIRNNGGGHANHSLFWQSLKQPGTRPRGKLRAALEKTYPGGVDARLQEVAMGVFGSGWAWLSAGEDGLLSIDPYPNQDTPLSRGRRPLLGIDVWEHAYYLKYQNRRADYLAAILKVINWDFVSARYEER